VSIRLLVPDDRETLAAFLATHADSSLFLRSNLRAVGIVDRGETYHATWAGAFDGDALVATAAHCWNGNVLVQAPVALPSVVTAAVAGSGRRVTGILGSWAQLVATRDALELAAAPTTFVSRDGLFALDVAALVVPPALAAGRVQCRATVAADLPLLVDWRVAYRVELLGQQDGPALREFAREEVERLHAEESSWLLETEASPVSYSAFNARLPDVVQIGGVYTPPALRARGHARAVVAGSLLAVAPSGVRRSILFTGDENHAARRAYESIGFRLVGDYGMVLF